MTARTPWLDPAGTPRDVVVQPRWWDGDGPIAVTLHPQPTGDAWEVYLPNGDLTSRWIGTVGRYEGTLDRGPISRGSRVSRGRGKRRTLWSVTHLWGGTDYDQTSRADCIRTLIREAQS